MTTQGPVTGLTAEEVERRRTAGQTNQPPHSATKTVREIVRDNVCTYFNLVFLLLAMALAMVGSYANMTFLGVVVCNTIIGIVQQLRSKKAVDELTLVAARRVRCTRQLPSSKWAQQRTVYSGHGKKSINPPFFARFPPPPCANRRFVLQ